MVYERENLSVCKVSDELRNLKKIPTKYHKDLEERLKLICQDYQRRPPDGKRRARENVQSRNRDKKSCTVYLTILARNPNTFLPFILAISPRVSRDLNADDYCDNYSDVDKIVLDGALEQTFNHIALALGINDTPIYKKISDLLFPKRVYPQSYQAPPPTTKAEGGEVFTYRVSDLTALRINFGDQVCDAIKSHRAHNAEGEYSGITTELVKAQVPKGTFDDGLFWIEIGHTNIDKLVQVLFPVKHQAISWLFQQNAKAALPLQRCEVEEARFTLCGASVEGIQMVFNPAVCIAIQYSQRRAWETLHGLFEDTDCLAMQIIVSHDKISSVVIRLRTGFIQTLTIINAIYVC
jgi:hypothetical protein